MARSRTADEHPTVAFRHRNGIDVIIDAFALLAREQPGLRLLIAGEGPSRAQYQVQVDRLPPSIASRVLFLGAVWQERPDLYASAQCFALGARKASFSILLLEALAAGLRVAALPRRHELRGRPLVDAEMSVSETP
jgi:glycosyltransferase involved in cell wall biosynthesis